MNIENVLEVSPGHWFTHFDDKNISQFVQCPLGKLSCIGGSSSAYGLLAPSEFGDSCGKSFQGLACAECPRDSYFNWFDLDCNECGYFEYMRHFIYVLALWILIPLIFSRSLLPDLSMFSRLSILKQKLSSPTSFVSIARNLISQSANDTNNNDIENWETNRRARSIYKDDEDDLELGQRDKVTRRELLTISTDDNSNNKMRDLEYKLDSIAIEGDEINLLKISPKSAHESEIERSVEAIDIQRHHKNVLISFQKLDSFFKNLTSFNVMINMIQIFTCLPWLFQVEVGSNSILQRISEALGRIAQTSIFRMSILTSCLSSDWNAISLFEFAAACYLAFPSLLFLFYESWVRRIHYCHKIGISVDHNEKESVRNGFESDDNSLEVRIALVLQQLRVYYFTLFLFFFILWAPGILQHGIDTLDCVDMGKVYSPLLFPSQGSAFLSFHSDIINNFTLSTLYSLPQIRIGSVLKSDVKISCETRHFRWNYYLFLGYNPIAIFLIIILLYLNTSRQKLFRLNRQERILLEERKTSNSSKRYFACQNYDAIQAEMLFPSQPLRAFFDSFSTSYWWWGAFDLIKRLIVLNVNLLDQMFYRYVISVAVLSGSVIFTSMAKPYRKICNNVLSIIADLTVLILVIYLFLIENFSGSLGSFLSRYGPKIGFHLFPMLIVAGMICYILFQVYHNNIESDKIYASLEDTKLEYRSNSPICDNSAGEYDRFRFLKAKEDNEVSEGVKDCDSQSDGLIVILKDDDDDDDDEEEEEVVIDDRDDADEVNLAHKEQEF